MTRARSQAIAVTGAVLVGGRSRRMGVDKAALLVDGRPLAEAVAAALRPVCVEVLLAGRPVPGVGGRVVTDPPDPPDGGPLAGIVACLEAARTPLLVAAACDMPSIVPALVADLVDRLAAAPPGRGAAMCKSADGLEPFPLALRTAVAPQLRDALVAHRLRLRDAVADLDPIIVARMEWSRLDPAGASFVNWNTPEDVRQGAAPRPRMRGHGDA